MRITEFQPCSQLHWVQSRQQAGTLTFIIRDDAHSLHLELLNCLNVVRWELNWLNVVRWEQGTTKLA